MRHRLLCLSVVLLGVLLLGGPVAAGAAPAAPAVPQNRSSAATPSTLTIDRTPDAPATPAPRSHLWVGAVIGAFGLLGLVWSRAFRPIDRPGRAASPPERSTA